MSISKESNPTLSFDSNEKYFPVIIIGGGQAGLSVSYLLSIHGIKHLVLERNQLGWEWRERRWKNFCLVTPNWQCLLPGFPYSGDDPDGFMVKDEIVAYLEEYARIVNPPLIEGVEVTLLRTIDESFELQTSLGKFLASQIVVATGPYNSPVIPKLSYSFPKSITQIHSCEYKCGSDLPKGEVLVVGTGQSGTQIAEDLHLDNKKVHLCVGRAPRVARRYRGKDVVAWLEQMQYYKKTIDEHPLGQSARENVNHYVTGRDGGHDIDLRQFKLEGMKLYGRLQSVVGSELFFANDLEKNLDYADSVSESIKDLIDDYIMKNNLEAPTEPRYVPVWRPNNYQQRLDLEKSKITSVIWATGFKPNYSWIDLAVFDENEMPIHKRGITKIPGLYFIGLPWLHTWGSARFSGIAQDAEYIVENIKAFSLDKFTQREFA